MTIRKSEKETPEMLYLLQGGVKFGLNVNFLSGEDLHE